MKARRNERWRKIEGYDGLYEVSDCGSVRRVGSESNRALSIDLGYYKVSLTKKGARNPSSHWVHRLVAAAFIKNPDSLPQVNHIDGNKLSNYHSNLEWNSAKQNMRHASLMGLIARGEKIGVSKLTRDKVLVIRDMSNNGASNVELAKKFRVSNSSISRVIHRQNWKHV